MLLQNVGKQYHELQQGGLAGLRIAEFWETTCKDQFCEDDLHRNAFVKRCEEEFPREAIILKVAQ